MPLLAFSHSEVNTSGFPYKPVNFFVVELNIFAVVMLIPLTGDHHQMVLFHCYKLILDKPTRRVVCFQDSISTDLDQTPEINLARVRFKHKEAFIIDKVCNHHAEFVVNIVGDWIRHNSVLAKHVVSYLNQVI